MLILKKMIAVSALSLVMSGCVGTLVGAVVDTTIEVAKVPFKVAGAVVDVASGDGNSKSKKSDDE